MVGVVSLGNGNGFKMVTKKNKFLFNLLLQDPGEVWGRRRGELFPSNIYIFRIKNKIK